MTELFLYQTLHICRAEVRRLEAHAAQLDEASRELFGRPYSPDLRQLAGRVLNLVRTERYPAGVSGFVRLELDAQGGERLTPAGVSLYDGYALRSLTPEAVSVPYELPFEALSSTHEAAAVLARQIALRHGAQVAIRCNAAGIALALDDAPLFAVKSGAVFTSPAPASVERSLGIEAVRAAGIDLTEYPVDRESLVLFDELFGVDHRGVTALSRCDGAPMMALTAERVAGAMESLFRKI